MIKIIGVVFHMMPPDGDRESKLYLYIPLFSGLG